MSDNKHANRKEGVEATARTEPCDERLIRSQSKFLSYFEYKK
jgi:hypothetical protein